MCHSFCLDVSNIANDGSGYITGMAYYQMRSEHLVMSRENEKVKIVNQKLREELRQSRERLNRERCVYIMNVPSNVW